jgi:hypothetical protein
MVISGTLRKSTRPLIGAGLARSASSMTSRGNRSGMPCWWMAISAMLRWSVTEPKRSVTLARATPRRGSPASSTATSSPGTPPPASDADSSYSLRAFLSVGMTRKRVAGTGAQHAEHAGARFEPAQHLGAVGIGGIAGLGEAGENAVAGARRLLVLARSGGAPRLDQDARRRPLRLFVPFERLGHQLAVVVDAGDQERGHRGQARGVEDLAGAALQQALLGHVAQHALERQLLRRRPDAEGARHVALVHLPGAAAHIIEEFRLAGKLLLGRFSPCRDFAGS